MLHCVYTARVEQYLSKDKRTIHRISLPGYQWNKQRGRFALLSLRKRRFLRKRAEQCDGTNKKRKEKKKNKIKSVVLAFNLSMDGRSAMGWRETGRGKTRRKRVSNERRSRHKVNRYGPCSSQGLTALRTPRRLYFLSFSFPRAPIVPSLYQRPSLRLWLSLMLAMWIEHHSSQTKVCRRGSALFLHSSIPELPSVARFASLASLKLLRISTRVRRRTKFLFFCFYITFTLFERIFWIFVVALFCEGPKLWKRDCGVVGGRKPPNCGIQNGKALVSGQSRLKLVECVTRNRKTWR